MDSSGGHLVAFLFAVICAHDVLLLRNFALFSPALRHQLKESGLSFLAGTECGHFEFVWTYRKIWLCTVLKRKRLQSYFFHYLCQLLIERSYFAHAIKHLSS